MPKITQISVQTNKKDRCNVFVDGEFYVALDIEIAMLNRIKVGLEISKEELDAIAFEGQKKDALNKGVAYVSKNLKTKKQVFTYLSGKGYSCEIVYYVIDKLKEYNYINDKEYAKRYLETYSSSQGKHLAEYKLMMKGVKKDDIANAYMYIEIPSKENARSLAEKRMKNKENTRENVAKTYRYLVGKGFTYEEAEYAVSIFKEND